MTPTLARQRGFFDALLGRPKWFPAVPNGTYSTSGLHQAVAESGLFQYLEGYALGAAALDPSEGR